jgi:hypothetical protein
MKNLILAVLCFFISISAFAGSEKLIGTWKSNKETTLNYLKTHTKLTPEQLAKVGGALGKMTITFDANNMTLKSGDWKFSSSYKFISETQNVIVIESEEPGNKKISQTKFEFEGDGFWTPDDKIPNYKERFDKVIQK